jgi:hypothetical protein
MFNSFCPLLIVSNRNVRIVRICLESGRVLKRTDQRRATDRFLNTIKAVVEKPGNLHPESA